MGQNVLKNPFSGGSSLPDYGAADDGKALMVQVDGSVAWELPPGAAGGEATTFEVLDGHGDVGSGADQVAVGNHDHSGVYEPADATILKEADIGTGASEVAAGDHTHANLHSHTNKTTLDAIPDHSGASDGQIIAVQADGSLAFEDQTGAGGGEATTFEVLDSNGDVGTGSAQVAQGDHSHDATYAPIAKGVTNGDSHDHSGGDGAQIAHTSLGSVGADDHHNRQHALGAVADHTSATLAQLNALVSDATLDDSSDSRTPSSHGNEAHASTFITSGGVTYENLNANSDIGLGASQVPEGDKVLALAGGTMGGNLNLADNDLVRANLKDTSHETQSVSSSSGSLSIDLTNGNVATTTLTENVTSFSVSNWPASGDYGELLIILTQDSTARTVDWSGAGTSVDYHTSDGNAPDISTTDEVYAVLLFTMDAGSNVHIMASKQ